MLALFGADAKRIIKLALPIMAQSVLFTSMSLVDTIMVGYIGTTELAGMGLAISIMLLFLSVVFSFSNSVSVIVAQNKNLPQTFKLILTNGLVLSILLAFSIFLLLNFFSGDVIHYFWGEADYTYKAIEYIYIVSYTILASAIIQVYIGFINALGNTYLTFLISAIGVISNITFSYPLIFGVVDYEGMGFTGAALGSVLSKIIEIVIIIYFLYRKYGGLYLDLSKFSLKCKSSSEIVRLGGTQAVNALLWAASVNLYTLIIASQGEDLVASAAIISSMTNLAYISYWGIAIAAGIVIGESLGNEQYERAKAISKLCIGLGVVFATLLTLILYLLKESVLSVYPELSATSVDFIQGAYVIVMVTIIVRSISTINMVGSLKSGGDNRYIIVIDVLAAWLFGIPLCYIILFHSDAPLYFAFAAPMIEDIVKALLSTTRIISGRWMKTIRVA